MPSQAAMIRQDLAKHAGALPAIPTSLYQLVRCARLSRGLDGSTFLCVGHVQVAIMHFCPHTSRAVMRGRLFRLKVALFVRNVRAAQSASCGMTEACLLLTARPTLMVGTSSVICQWSVFLPIFVGVLVCLRSCCASVFLSGLPFAHLSRCLCLGTKF